MTLAVCPATLLGDPFRASADEVAAAGRAAVGAGFTEASVWTLHQEALGAGLRTVVVEAGLAWAGTDDEAASREAGELAAAARERGASMVLTFAVDLADPDTARAHLGSLAERCRDVGARVAVEFLRDSGLPTLAAAWELIEPLGDVGLVVDTFHLHHQDGGPDLSLLASVPGDRIGFLQVADSPAVLTADYLTAALTERLLPGDGVADLAAMLGALEDAGADPLIAPEVFSPALVTERGVEMLAADVRTTTLAAVSGFRGSASAR